MEKLTINHRQRGLVEIVNIWRYAINGNYLMVTTRREITVDGSIENTLIEETTVYDLKDIISYTTLTKTYKYGYQ